MAASARLERDHERLNSQPDAYRVTRSQIARVGGGVGLGQGATDTHRLPDRRQRLGVAVDASEAAGVSARTACERVVRRARLNLRPIRSQLPEPGRRPPR